ncbi:MAG TPA: helix-turn-helix domain-containing protein [Polyangiaceae bacterium]
MKYREYAPAPALRAHVACYWSLEAADSSGHRVLPDGCMDLLFDMSGCGGASLVGAMTTAIVTPPAARVTLFGVRFLPGEAFAFTEVPAREVLDVAVPLTEIWGRRAGGLAERVVALTDMAARVRCLDQALLAARPRAADARVRRAVQTLLRAPAPVGVAALASEAGVSERHLERAFVERVGMGPKRLGRIARLQRLLGRIAWCPADDEARPWATIASEFGFADQAHLAREVKALSGLTPTALAREGMQPAWT